MRGEGGKTLRLENYFAKIYEVNNDDPPTNKQCFMLFKDEKIFWIILYVHPRCTDGLGDSWRWRNIEYVENNSPKLIIISFNTWEQLATCPFYFRVAKYEKFVKFLVWLSVHFSSGWLEAEWDDKCGRWEITLHKTGRQNNTFILFEEFCYFIAFSPYRTEV